MNGFGCLLGSALLGDGSVTLRWLRPVVALVILCGLVCLPGPTGAAGLPRVDEPSASDGTSYCAPWWLDTPLPWCDQARVADPSMPAASGALARHGSGFDPGVAPLVSVYRDPETGRFVKPPAGVSIVLPRAARVPRGPLVQRRATGLAGGFRVDVSERFAAAVVAERSPDGTLSIDCGEEISHSIVDREAMGEGGDR